MVVVNEPGPSGMSRVAAADALFVAAALVLCLICEIAYDVALGLVNLVAVLLLGSVPLAFVISLNGLSWLRITGVHVQAPPLRGAREATGLATAALPLLIFGALFTVIDVVFGEKDSTFASATSTAVVYLLLAALAAQTVLLVLTWLMRRKPRAPSR